MMEYKVNLPMYFVMRMHEVYPESTKSISEKNSTEVGKFLYEGAVNDPQSLIKKELYCEWRDINCPNYRQFLKEACIETDIVSASALPKIAV